MEQISTLFQTNMEVIRYKGKWYKIHSKSYEPEYQTYKVAWMSVKHPEMSPQEVYKLYFEKEREIVKVLYPSFRKDVVD